MAVSSPPALRYGLPAIVLHWLLALAIIGMFIMGWYMVDLPFSPQRLKLYNWHKWAGMTVLALTLVRLLWRFTHRPPALPAAIAAAMPRWQHWAHHATHGLMYLLCLVVPLVGWAYSSAAGLQIVYFGVLPLPDFVPASPALADAIKPWHAVAAYALGALVLLHLAAVFKHQWLDRDGLLARMLPGRG